MKIIKIIIIGKEIEIISRLQQKLKFIFPNTTRMIATTSSITEAYPLIINSNPDFVFFDLDTLQKSELGLFKGFSKSGFKMALISVSKKITYWTAYIKAILKSSILDFLYKSIQKQDAEKLAEKNVLYFRQEQNDKSICISTLEGTYVVKLKNIIRLKGNGSCTDIFIKDRRKITKSINIGAFREILPKKIFHSSHKSHIINGYHVKSYTRKIIKMSDGAEVPIARGKVRYDDFEDFIKGINGENEE